MQPTKLQDQSKLNRKDSRIPQGSLFFEKIVPMLLAGMGILMLVLILFAAGVLVGLIQF